MDKKQIDRDVKALAKEWFKNVKHHNDCEFGSVGSDCKRPFGNSDVEEDILDIIGAPMQGDDGYGKCWSSTQKKYARDLYTKNMVKFINNLEIGNE